MTDAERKLWSRLRAHQLGVHFRRQAPLGSYVLDFVCFAACVVVEVDGGQHADSPSDQARDAWLQGQGFQVLRFWNNEVLENIDGVLETIMAKLNSAESPPPQPSPMKGEGDNQSALPAPSPFMGDNLSALPTPSLLAGDDRSALPAPSPFMGEGWGGGAGK